MDANVLSDREIEVLRLVGQGKSNKEIAMDLDISVNTVKVHVSNIYQKIGVSSRTEATLFAIENGVVNPALPQDDRPIPSEGLTDVRTTDTVKHLGRNTILLLALLGASIVAIVLFLVIRHNTTDTSNSSLMVNFSAKDRWVAYNPLPSPRSDIAAVTYESQIFTIGGNLNDGVSGSTEVFSQTENVWTSLEDKPTPVSGATAILIGERIFVPGGKTADGKVTDNLEVFDPRHSVWEEKANLPIGLSNYGLAAFEGKLYLFGGWAGSQPSDSVYYYDPDQDAWSEISKLPYPSTTVLAVQIENRIVLTGKTEPTSSETFLLSYYPNRDEPGDNPWEEGTPIPIMGDVSCFFNLLETLYAVVNDGNTTDFLVYDEQKKDWESIGQNDALLSQNTQCSIIGGELFLIGGTNANGAPSDQLLGYKMIYSISLPSIVN